MAATPRPAAPAASAPIEPGQGPATGGTAIPAPAATGVLADTPVQTEGAVRPDGTVTSHPGAPTGEAPGLRTASAGALATTVLPPTATVAPAVEKEFAVRNMLRQPLHHRTGTIPAYGTKYADQRPADIFMATEKEILAYGAQVARV